MVLGEILGGRDDSLNDVPALGHTGGGLENLPSIPLPRRPVRPQGLSGRLESSTSYSPSWLTLFTWITCCHLILVSFLHLILPDEGHRNQGIEGRLPKALVAEVCEVSLTNLQKSDASFESYN